MYGQLLHKNPIIYKYIKLPSMTSNSDKNNSQYKWAIVNIFCWTKQKIVSAVNTYTFISANYGDIQSFVFMFLPKYIKTLRLFPIYIINYNEIFISNISVNTYKPNYCKFVSSV